MNFFEYFADNLPLVFERLWEHIRITLIAITIAIAIGVVLGIIISYIKPLKKFVLGATNLMQALPTIAMLGFLVPIMGIGDVPATVMVVVYSLLPIIKNTATGLLNINKDTLEAAKAIGMTRFQVLVRVQLPLALPMIMSGIRIAAVTAVGLVTLAAFIGAGGLGYIIYSGIRTAHNEMILLGTIPACLLALAVDFLMSIVEKLVTPACFKNKIKSKKLLKNPGGKQ